MICVSELRKVYAEKLAKTNDMGAAFVKAVWVAYKQGLADGKLTNLGNDDDTKNIQRHLQQ